MKNLIVLLAVLVFGAACTKEKPYEYVGDKRTSNKNLFPKTDLGTLQASCTSQVTQQIAQEKANLESQIEKNPSQKTVLEEKIKNLEASKGEQVNSCVASETRIAIVSYGQATRTARASMPYFVGRTKLVTFEISEHSLDVKEVEKDPRFAGNPANARTILSIPVRHIDYKCETDAYGECQNREIENDDINWKDRRNILMDIGAVKTLDTEELPIEITKLVSGCYSVGEQKLVSSELSGDVFNFEIQRSYSLNLISSECWGEISDFEDLFEKLNFDVHYVYSIVKSKNLISKNYRSVVYEKEDEGAFGFFDTKINKLDVDNSNVVGKDVVLLNRWNPERKVVPYYLSDEFNKPEYDYVLAATEQAVQNVNNALAQAEAGFVIELRKPAGKKVGDLRNNMIVMVDDPLAARIIGYGPSVAHPLTGEIVNARTVMYLGTIKTLVKRTYEDIRAELLAEKEDQEAETVSEPVLASVLEVKKSLQQFMNGKSQLANLGKMNVLVSQKAQATLAAISLDGESGLKARAAKRSLLTGGGNGNGITAGTMQRIKNDILSFRKSEAFSPQAKTSKYIDKRIEVLSRNNVYPEELFNADFALKSAGVDKILQKDLRPWDELSGEEKEELVRTVLPHIWIPTLVHEMGHNLGLRHNFAGSEDKANFYSEKELKDMGITRPIPYASVMEYSFKTTNELPTMGKYDIAALRFAYARKVEVVAKNGTTLRNVETKIEDLQKQLLLENAGKPEEEHVALKEYRYCTDEHVSANPTCNRFDEGTNLVEIANHFITAYDDLYKRSNRRGDRENFSVFQEGSYLSRLANTFYFLRLSTELYEKIKSDYGVADSNPAWQQIDFLKDILDASTMGGQFFLGILLTPDVHCAISLQQQPKIPIALLKVKDLHPFATNCFHPEVLKNLEEIGENNKLKLVMAGEGGKSFKSRKDPLNPNAYADQIDVQGIWIDKLLALEFLFTRELGSSLFDGHTDNYLDHVGVGKFTENILSAILLGRGAVQVPFKDAQDQSVKFMGADGKLTSTLPVSIEFGEEHKIEVPALGGLTRYFGLPNEMTTFNRQLVETLQRLVPARVESQASKNFREAFTLYKGLVVKDHSEKGFAAATEVGAYKYLASKDNRVAVVAIKSLIYSRVLSKATVEEVEAVMELKQGGKPLPDGTAERLKAVYELPVEVMDAYINGVIKQPTFYEELLESLTVRSLD